MTAAGLQEVAQRIQLIAPKEALWRHSCRPHSRIDSYGGPADTTAVRRIIQDEHDAI
jgi:hypothetical protein